MKSLLVMLFLALSISVNAQLVQTIRGKITDKESKSAIVGANIIVVNSNPVLGTTSDANGNFKISGVPVGRQSLRISFVGYKTSSADNLIIQSGKEMILEIALEENVILGQEVIIKANARKDQTINAMATVSARTFTVEETEKFAGSRGDVARMAMNYAGVAAANDQRNDIIIRGNSPSGLLWRLDEIEIPNPNHFAENGTTGGPVGMLNNNLLQNSDFYTGAFPAEYGNALSGVFDLKLRNGNNEKHEFLIQTGFNGFEFGAEGPLSKNKRASYLVNFRYSTLELVGKFIDIGTAGIPKYKDYCYKLNFPLAHGKISLWGIGGWSEIAMLNSQKEQADLYSNEGQDLYNHSKMSGQGISFTRFLNDKTYAKFAISTIYSEGGTKIDTLDNNMQIHRYLNHSYLEKKLSASFLLNRKFNSQFTLKLGISEDFTGFDLNTNSYDPPSQNFKTYVNYSQGLMNGTKLFRAYSAANYKFSDNLVVNPGVYLQYLDLNGQLSVEPRVGLSWQVNASGKFSFGYGLHSKAQNLYTYYYATELADRSIIETNKKIGFTKSHQIVTAYDYRISENTRFKAEAYYQYLFDVPVELKSSTYSILNTGANWGMWVEDSLVNKGKGRNYGLEFTLEQFLSKGFYYLSTLSIYNSKYTASNGLEYNTAFNGHYVWNVLFGKEIKLSQKTSLSLDYKMTWAGGKRYSEIDKVKSRKESETKYDESRPFANQFSSFFKADLKLGLRINSKHLTQEWQFYVENLSNHKNPLALSYNKTKDEVETIYQLGFFPMVNYRLIF